MDYQQQSQRKEESAETGDGGKGVFTKRKNNSALAPMHCTYKLTTIHNRNNSIFPSSSARVTILPRPFTQKLRCRPATLLVLDCWLAVSLDWNHQSSFPSKSLNQISLLKSSSSLAFSPSFSVSRIVPALFSSACCSCSFMASSRLYCPVRKCDQQ